VTTTTTRSQFKRISPASNSSWALAWRRFRRHKVALGGGAVVLTFVLLALFSPWISPYDYRNQNLSLRFQAPDLSLAASAQADKCLQPRTLLWECGVHPFGTDQLGRDVLTRVLHGGRVSLLVGFLAAFLSTLLGSLLGAFAGYIGGVIDSIISRFIDIMLSLPQIPLLLILSALLSNRDVALGQWLDDWLGGSKSIIIIISVIILFSWMGTARLVRGEILSLKQREFSDAARALGSSHWRVVVRHLIPNAMAVIIVQFSLMMGESILVESGLSFLGLGIQPPAVSWGNMLSGAQGFLFRTNGIFIAVFPGLFIFLTVLCFNLLGDGLRDALDPRSVRK